jgi:hypothetical protein
VWACLSSISVRSFIRQAPMVHRLPPSSRKLKTIFRLLRYSLQIHYINKLCVYFQDLLPNNIPESQSVDSVVPISSVRASPMLLLVVSNDNADQHSVHTKFREDRLAGLKLKLRDDIHTYTHGHYGHLVNCIFPFKEGSGLRDRQYLDRLRSYQTFQEATKIRNLMRDGNYMHICFNI